MDAGTPSTRVGPSLESIDVATLDTTTRTALARRWQEDAALEHASVAAFGRLSLELLALGAPPALVAAAHECALDEVRHAQASYAIASRYAGTTLGPAPFDLGGLDVARIAPAAFAAETFTDGCIGEAVASAVARASAETAPEPLRSILAGIAEDEERHAEVAWRMLAWAVETGGSDARAALATGLRDVTREVAGDAEASSAPSAAGGPLAPHGVLDAPTEAAIRRTVLRDVAIPCARALLVLR